MDPNLIIGALTFLVPIVLLAFVAIYIKSLSHKRLDFVKQSAKVPILERENREMRELVDNINDAIYKYHHLKLEEVHTLSIIVDEVSRYNKEIAEAKLTRDKVRYRQAKTRLQGDR